MHPERRKLLVGVLSCSVAVAFEAFAALTAMPAAAADLGDLPLYAWTYTGFVIGTLFAIVAAGRWADRSGPAAPLATGMVVFALGLVLSASAPTMLVLLLGRTVQGLGAGTIQIAQTVVLAHGFPTEERPVVMTWFSAAWLLPSLVGPGIAAWLAETFSWHVVFWSVFPLLALSAVLLALTVGRIKGGEDPESAPPVSLWTAAGVALGVTGLQYAGQVAAESQWWLMAGGLVAALGLVALPRLLPHHHTPHAGTMTAAVVTRALVSGAFFGTQTFVSLWLVTVRGLSLFAAGAMVSAGAVGWMLGSWLQSRSWLRLSRGRLVVLGAGSVTAGVGFVALAALLPGTWVGLAGLGAIGGGLGMGLLVASTSLVVMQLSRGGEQGRNASSLQVGEALGGSVLTGAAGTWFALQGADPAVFGGLFAGLTLCAAASVLVARRIQIPATQEA